jgi:hypothetical protein
MSDQANGEWFELKGRVFRFLGTHPGWARWQGAVGDEAGVWICGQEKERELALARGTRVAAVVRDTKLIGSRSIPEHHAVADITAQGWNRLLLGVFVYLGGPARLDDVVTIAAAALRMPGAGAMVTGVAVTFPGDGHVSYEDMDLMVEGRSEAGVEAHVAGCEFCARQVSSYLNAAERVSMALLKPVVM